MPLANIVAMVVDEQVGGGGITAVSRVDGTIRRSTGWWSDAVHALLGHLEASKFEPSPRFLGTDGHGREILSELPGRPCLGQEVDGDALVASAAGLIRRYHDLVAGWSYPADGWQRAPGAEVDGEVVCHNDLATWNFLYDGNNVTGLVDWDVAAPGTVRGTWPTSLTAGSLGRPRKPGRHGPPGRSPCAPPHDARARQLRLLRPALGRRDSGHPRPGRSRLPHCQDVGSRRPARMGPAVGATRTVEARSRVPETCNGYAATLRGDTPITDPTTTPMLSVSSRSLTRTRFEGRRGNR